MARKFEIETLFLGNPERYIFLSVAGSEFYDFLLYKTPDPHLHAE